MSVALALVAALTLSGPGVSFSTSKAAKKGYYTTSLTTPLFSGSAFAPAVNKSVSQNARNAVAAWLKDSFKDMGNERPRLEYFYTAAPTVTLNRADIVSFYFTVSTYTAGAHPMTVSDPHTYVPTATGAREIAAKDVYLSNVDYKTAISNLVIGKLLNNDRAMWVQDGTVKELTAAQLENFVVTPTAITYLFDPYDMGPYAVGAFQVKLPFTELKNIIDPKGALGPLLK
jgi:hypothetical protein